MLKKKVLRAFILFAFFAATSVFTITACNSEIGWFDRGEDTSIAVYPDRLEQNSVEKKSVNHALGQVEIPLSPQKIVVLDNSFLLDPLLALGISPAGIAVWPDSISSDTLSDRVADIPSVGDWERPSLEKILSLKPDLIIGHVWQRAQYSLLSEIAPTVLLGTDSRVDYRVDFKENLTYLADILDKGDKASELLANYNMRIEEFRQKLGNGLDNMTVSIVHLNGSQPSVYGPNLVPYAQVLIDAGIPLIPAYKNLKRSKFLSVEALPDWDADVLFVVILQEEESEQLESLSFLQQPIWKNLKAVQDGNVYGVSWASTVVGPITANQLIDDLYQYFIDEL